MRVEAIERGRLHSSVTALGGWGEDATGP